MAFKNPEQFAEIVDLPAELIRDMGTMIDALSSGYRLNADEFQKMADSWMDRFHTTYKTWNWFSPYVLMLLDSSSTYKIHTFNQSFHIMYVTG